MGQKQSYEVSKEAAAVQPVYRESAEDEIKRWEQLAEKEIEMQKARRDPADVPVITPVVTPTGSPKQTPKQEKKATPEAVKEEKHEERNIDQSVRKAEEAASTVHILPYAEGEMATVHNIIVDDEHKKEPKEAVAVVAH
ncbi:hypothetical protein PRIPAC_89693 [Pristionchus pacificus]|uniref:Uncharacterized protein n=1 Tax=Pristionchus pacificus TaxID=54126 RepID=A0A2A6CTF7_PRIPA|nr:hypothetical protein PRIPAC_89693 [Pristionchus pacificus]|eukprot:PDM81429.1 hypothetical protein PRIPAC_35305 [Pristionchus pacificus]